MSPHNIRTFGDPVLTSAAEDVTEIDGRLARLCDDMLVTMYDAPGVGLAAPQVGVRRRFFVYDHGDGPGVLINPQIVESDGEYVMEEGCLSVPGMSWEIVRPNRIHVVAWNIDGEQVEFEAEEFFARLIQHEIDHLDGKLLLDQLDADQRKEALRLLRERAALAPPSGLPDAVEKPRSSGGLRLP